MANDVSKPESPKGNTQAKSKPIQSPVKTESTYTVAEFISAPETTGANADIVKAALLADGKASYTVSEAKNIVNKFKSKEVN